MPNRVVHFEIEAKDKERAKKFYSSAFGWEMQDQGSDYGGYVVAVTGDSKEPGGINGGIFQAPKDKQINAYRCVIAVDDIEKSITDVKANGGKVLGEKPDNVPQVGLFMNCEDTEGNRFSLLQPSSDMSSQK